MRLLTFASRDADIDCADPARAVDAAADSLDRRGFAVFRIGRLRLDADRSRARAGALMASLREAMVARGAPGGTTVEAGAPQATIMPGGATVRTMLPHHDGQHASYLTPSRMDMPGWQPRWRVFSDDGYTTSHTHKLYQAIFIADPGEGLSVTPVYDLLRILADGHRHGGPSGEEGGTEQVGTEQGATDEGGTAVEAVARWLGGNLRRAHELRAVHGSVYPTLAGMLGLDDAGLQATPLIRAEAEVDATHLDRYPDLMPLVQRCPCGTCEGGTLRVFCHVTHAGLGVGWPGFRERYETCVVTERFDLLVSHNLTMHHGGLAGGASRVLEPFYLAVAHADGDDYERWLGAQWRARA